MLMALNHSVSLDNVLAMLMTTSYTLCMTKNNTLAVRLCIVPMLPSVRFLNMSFLGSSCKPEDEAIQTQVS